MTTDEPLINLQDAAQLVEGLSSPVARNYLTLVLARLRLRATREVEMTEESWHRRLPAAPLDVLFIVQALQDVVGDARLMRAIADGQDLATASGWDV
jgi:hypothetical protein